MPLSRFRMAGSASRAKQLGVTDEDYALLLASQGGGCAICGNPPRTRRLHVDHDHKTGRIRGLLCFTCNHFTLGRYAQPWKLRRAADYLEGTLDVARVEREILPSMAAMQREAARVTPRR